MIDRMLMVTRKIAEKLDAMQNNLEQIYEEIYKNKDFIVEAEKLEKVINEFKEFELDIEDLEHVILAEGLR